MKISREISINGESTPVTYELTGIELEHAYNEYRHTMINNAICQSLKDREENYVVEDIPEDLMDKIINGVEYDLDTDALNDSVDAKITKYKGELEQYKKRWKAYSVRVTATVTHEYTVRAEDEDDAERIFAEWSEHHSDEMARDLSDDLVDEVSSVDIETDYPDEEPDFDPDNADITVERGE